MNINDLANNLGNELVKGILGEIKVNDPSITPEKVEKLNSIFYNKVLFDIYWDFWNKKHNYKELNYIHDIPTYLKEISKSKLIQIYQDLQKAIDKIQEDKIPGGLSQGKTLYDIAKHHKVDVKLLRSQLRKGIKVEMEHTTSKSIAKEIAMDHLFEDPKYYNKLEKIETNEIKVNKPIQPDENFLRKLKYDVKWFEDADLDHDNDLISNLKKLTIYKEIPDEQLKQLIKKVKSEIDEIKINNPSIDFDSCMDLIEQIREHLKITQNVREITHKWFRFWDNNSTKGKYISLYYNEHPEKIPKLYQDLQKFIKDNNIPLNEVKINDPIISHEEVWNFLDENWFDATSAIMDVLDKYGLDSYNSEEKDRKKFINKLPYSKLVGFYNELKEAIKNNIDEIKINDPGLNLTNPKIVRVVRNGPDSEYFRHNQIYDLVDVGSHFTPIPFPSNEGTLLLFPKKEFTITDEYGKPDYDNRLNQTGIDYLKLWAKNKKEIVQESTQSFTDRLLKEFNKGVDEIKVNKPNAKIDWDYKYMPLENEDGYRSYTARGTDENGKKWIGTSYFYGEEFEKVEDIEPLDEIKVNDPTIKIWDFTKYQPNFDYDKIKEGEILKKKDSNGKVWEFKVIKRDHNGVFTEPIGALSRWDLERWNKQVKNIQEIKINQPGLRSPHLVSSQEDWDILWPILKQKGYKWGSGRPLTNDLGNTFPAYVKLRNDGYKEIIVGQYQEEGEYSKHGLFENKQNPNYKKYINYINQILEYCCNELKIERPKVVIVGEKYTQENTSFGGYQPGENKIYLVIKNRVCSDSGRTLAHEIKHAHQDQQGVLTPESGKDGSEHENEANSFSGTVMRHFNREFPEILTLTIND